MGGKRNRVPNQGRTTRKTISSDRAGIRKAITAVAMNGGKLVLEASGNVDLDTVRAIAETGVDYISSGALTHSAGTVDFGLDF